MKKILMAVFLVVAMCSSMFADDVRISYVLSEKLTSLSSVSTAITPLPDRKYVLIQNQKMNTTPICIKVGSVLATMGSSSYEIQPGETWGPKYLAASVPVSVVSSATVNVMLEQGK